MSNGSVRPYVVVLVLAIAAGVGFFARRQVNEPAVPLPADLAGLSPGLVALIQDQAELVREAPRDARRHATLGLVYEANSLWVEARYAYQNASSLEPLEPMWAYHAVLAAQRAGDTDGALAMFRRYSPRYPEFAPLQHRYGDALLGIDALDEAQEAFTRAVANAPLAAEPHAGLGEVLLLRGDDTGAVEALHKALELDPSYRSPRYLLGLAYRNLGRMEAAERELNSGLNAAKRAMRDAWMERTPNFKLGLGLEFDRARGLLAAGRTAEAASILESEVGKRPDEVPLLVNLGVAYAQLERFDDALAIFLRAEKLDDATVEVFVNLSATYHKLGRIQDAVAAVDRAIRLEPQNPRGHILRGSLFEDLSRLDEAYRSFSTAARYDSSNPIVCEKLGELCVELGSYEEAKEHFETLVEMLPAAWQPNLRLSIVCLKLEDWVGARAALEAARELAPNEPAVQAIAQQLNQLDKG